MLQNPSLPAHVRQSTVHQFQQTQMQLQQAQAFATLAADMSAAAAASVSQQSAAPMSQNFAPNSWVSPFPNQQPAGHDSAYQRLPVSNRRRSNKRERPSDFLEIGGSEQQVKMPKFWE